MTTIVIACIAGFIAAVVDAIVGGGGLVTIPALLALGLPTYTALGTNKFASSMGAFSSAYQYYKSGHMNLKLLKYLLPFSLLGSCIGVITVLGVDPDFLKKAIIVLVLVIGTYTVFHKELGLVDNFKGISQKTIMLGILLALTLGFYDGFFGPGTGSFLIFGLINIYGFNFIRASANTKLLNLTSNLTALVLFFIDGKIYFHIGIPMALSMVLGARVGAKLAINKGSKFVKPMFVVMSLLLVIKMIMDIVFG